ncbi:MAG: ATP-binding cassette domain-containing protein [Propionibacteriaceae bacterium]|jgi:peptide/nickel transport system ATP-binding protein|nr:ATP-binding cassette domain-containing protein [Propionibacteriaceae bacterium]
MPEPREPVIECRDIIVEYPGHPPVRAVDGVSFELYPGEVVGLVGESGCGKSTMAKVLTGLLKPSAGEVVYQGKPLKPLGFGGRDVAETGIQMVFQDPGSSLNPRRRVGPQIQDGLDTAVRRLKTPEHPATPAEWLTRIGMSPKDVGRFPRSFSGGQRQRIATARALAAEPNVLIGDEPISALDASTQARVAYLMSTLAVSQGATLLFISHDLSVVRLIADRLLVMYRGHIVERGRTDEIWNDPRHPYTQALLGAIPVPDGAGRMPAATPPGTDYPLEEAIR